MHAKFNINLTGKNFEDYYADGLSIHEENKKVVQNDLEKFKDADGYLQANDLIDEWFPSIRADIFLSHSHKDERLVIGLAGWLNKFFGLKSFIDSTVWGYSNELLKIIDEKYCKNDSGKTYSYELRNRSTSHVHMMLSTALADMINQCECIIFVNTENSFRPIDYLNNKGGTESPWIYSEIAMTRMIQQRSPEDHRPISQMRMESADFEKRSKKLKILYPMNILHLTDLSFDDLMNLNKVFSKSSAKGTNVLDVLYSMKKKNYG